MTQLPPGWATALLGEVAATSLGKMLDSKRNTGANPVPYLRNINVRWGAFDLRELLTMDIRPEELDRVLARRGDVIACEGGEPGRAAVWHHDEPIAIQKALHLVRPRAGVNPHFLALLLRHQASSGQLDRLSTGTTIKHLPQEKLRLVEVPLAPAAEQGRIVAAIEEAFSLLDAGENALRNTRTRLWRMRDSVLTAAVTGQLVAQDPTETPASKSLADLGIVPVGLSDAAYEIPESWAWCRVSDLLSQPLANGRSVPTRDDGFPVLRLTCLRDGGIDLRERKGGDWTAAEAAPFLVASGDFLVSRGNGSLNLVGRGGLIRATPDPVAFPDTLIRVRVNTAAVSPELLEVWWRTGLVRRHIESRARTTAGIYKINQGVIEDLLLPVPPHAEQSRIVAEVERQFSFVEAAERAVDAGLVRSSGLRRSVLKAAFQGRLVEQDPADEPASVLLERIAAERAAQEPRKRAPRGVRGKVVGRE